MNAAIRTEKLQKRFGSVKALNGLTLTVDYGTVFGFLGPNGAGKTTTIRMLTGLSHPSGGKAWVAGMDIRQSAKVANRIGYLPEEPAFYNWMTPVEYLDHIGRIFGLKSIERNQRSKELLEKVDLSSVKKRRIGGFSRGMRQRLGLAQALVNKPEVLFLDEPVSALDPAGRKEVLEMITDLRGQCAVFMSTHILADVERICDSVGIINKGRLIVEARQDELMSRYSVPAFEVEVDPGTEHQLKSWLKGLSRNKWYKTATTEGTRARIIVKDMTAARQVLMAQAVVSGLMLRRIEIVTPTLEDVFLELVNGKGGAK